MYCSNCGNALKKGLNYCNSCGGKIAASAEENSLKKSISTALGYIGIFGFMGFIILVKILVDNRLDEGILAAICIAYLLTLFSICFMLIKQIASDKKETVNTVYPVTNSEPKQFTQNNTTNRLEEAKQQPASVSENTTKVLDELPIERK